GGNGGSGVTFGDTHGYGTGTSSGAGTANGGAGGTGDNVTFTLKDGAVTLGNDIVDRVHVIAGAGGSGGAGAGAGAGGSGGDATLKGGANTILTLRGSGVDFEVASGAGGITAGGPGAKGGAALVEMQGSTLNFTNGGKFWIEKGTANDGDGGDITINIGTLMATGSTISMRSFGRRAADDVVNLGALTLINDGASPGGYETRDKWTADGKGDFNYTFQNLYVVGKNNRFATETENDTFAGDFTGAGLYTPGNTGIITLDISGVARGETVLNATAGQPSNGIAGYGANYTDGVDLDGFNYDNLFIQTTYDSAVAQSGAANKITLISGAANGTDTAVIVAYGTSGRVVYNIDYTVGVAATSMGNVKAFAGPVDDFGYSAYLASNMAGLQTARDAYLSTFYLLDNFIETPELDKIMLKMVTIGRGSWKDKYDAGHIENDMWGFNLGLGYKTGTGLGLTTFGAFLEGGKGDYDTWNNTVLSGLVQGSGEIEYFGGGLVFHNQFQNNVYVEASVRSGSLDNEFSDSFGAGTYYDSSTSYFGAHLGLGCKQYISDDFDMNYYGRMIWTRLNSNDFSNLAGERFNMDLADSFRTQLGFRAAKSFGNGAVKAYGGLAWQHEFDGEGSGRIDGRNIVSMGDVDMKGSSALGEFGFQIRPGGDAPYVIEAGVFGSLGQSQGAGGTVGLKVEF
ncbi:autotransporter outer membrane beta-barrel domain-containing protein, partial [Deltaproteobacteria bacterium OttesenSCG-928-M10]|nr:autotransporter outer membrane beta-barrel domain-containing protein [Deltaproteobacteria bacterium OttesenSCG-928-M10]